MNKKSKKPSATDETSNTSQQPTGATRRDLLKGGAGVVAGAAMVPALSVTAAAGGRGHDHHDRHDDKHDDGDTYARLERANRDRNRVILLKGGTVITMDPAVPDLVKGDVLIKGKKIVAVGADLSAAARDRKCVVVNAKGTIVVPGMVDCHQHSWEGQLKNIIPSGVIADYTNTTHMGFGPFYRPQDMYAGNLLVMLDAIDAGTTCVIDHSHNSRTSAHSDAAIDAIFDSGIRAMYAIGAPQAGTWDMQLPNDLIRTQDKYFLSEDQLVTLSYRVGVNLAEVPLWQFGRSLGLWLTHDGGSNSPALFDFYNMGLLDERHNFSHGSNAPLANFQLIKDVGAHINYCVRSDTQYQLGFGVPVSLDNALAIGLRPGLSVDNVISYSGGVLAEMRAMFHVKRGYDQYRRSVLGQTPPVPPISVRDCLEFATIRGAGNAGLANKVGSLTPGKEADILMIRADTMNTLPLNNAVGVVVNFAERHNVEAVFIAGKVMKWNSKLVGVNMSKVRKLAEESRQYLFNARGYTLDILS